MTTTQSILLKFEDAKVLRQLNGRRIWQTKRRVESRRIENIWITLRGYEIYLFFLVDNLFLYTKVICSPLCSAPSDPCNDLEVFFFLSLHRWVGVCIFHFHCHSADCRSFPCINSEYASVLQPSVRCRTSVWWKSMLGSRNVRLSKILETCSPSITTAVMWFLVLEPGDSQVAW